MKFDDLLDLMESRFRKHKNVEHMADYPMFSVFVDSKVWKTNSNFRVVWRMLEDELPGLFQQARTRIQKIGFPTMHANVVFRNFKDDTYKPSHTALGYAVGNKENNKSYEDLKGQDQKHEVRHMALNMGLLGGIIFGKNPEKSREALVNTLVHEWAHLWAFNNTDEFQNAVNEYYKNIYGSHSDILARKRIPPEMEQAAHNIHRELKAYGMHFIDYDIALDPQHVEDDIRKIVEAGVREMALNNMEFLVDNIAEGLTEILVNFNPKITKEEKIKMYIEELDGFNIPESFIKIKDNDLFSKITRRELTNELSKLVKWVNEYGMTNSYELWATGIEHFLKLEPYHRKRILQIMQA